MPQDTRIPGSREPIAETAGITSRPWYRFFSNLFEFLGLGQGVIPATSGGTGNITYAPGDLLYADSASTWSRLSVTDAYCSVSSTCGG